jgi:hypothetical protein
MKNKRTLLIVLLTLLIISGSGCQKAEEVILDIGGGLSTPQYAPTPVKVYTTPLPEFDPMQFAWFYKPPQRDSDLGAVAANFSLLILTRNDEKERARLKDMGNHSPVLQYLRSEAIMDPGNCSGKPYQNQVANLEGDYCMLESQHPDWFLKDINGHDIPYDGSSYILMDQGNSQWQAFFLDKVKGFQSDPEWSGVFLDNVDGSLGRFENMHVLLSEYANDAAFQNAELSFLRNLYTSYFAPYGKLLYANIPYLEDNNVWFAYLQYLDGAMLESFTVDWDNGYLNKEEWLAQLDLAEKTQALGKSIILVTQGRLDDQQRMEYGLASYLLVNDGKAFFRYTNTDSYRDLWWYPQFETDLGQPLGPRYQDGKQWRRNFEKGEVLVNPANHSAKIITN